MKLPLFPERASNLAGDVDTLFYFMLGVSLIILLLIFAPLFFFLGKYRRGTKAERGPVRFSTLKLELAWIVIPFFLVMVMFAWGADLFLKIRTTPTGTLDVHVVGKQWMWHLQHASGHREINELHVPVGETVRITMTSEDVIHSFFLPAFRLKQDVIPGRYSTLWLIATKPGVSHLFCAEYCGTKHSGMVGQVVVMERQEYEEWLSAGTVAESIVNSGQRLFRERGCSGCHTPNPVVRAPALEGLYGRPVPLQDGRIVQADDQYIHDSILLPQTQVAAGYESLMPTYQGLLSQEEVFQLVAYIKSLVTPRLEERP
jgi:cytochrome c oxidase subunit II